MPNALKKTAMVGWYDPGQLARTAAEVVVSTLFGRHADPRLLEALSSREATVHDYAKGDHDGPRADIWIDYVADTATASTRPTPSPTTSRAPCSICAGPMASITGPSAGES